MVSDGQVFHEVLLCSVHEVMCEEEEGENGQKEML